MNGSLHPGRWMLVVVVAAIVASACSGSGSEPADFTATTPGSSSSSSTTTAPETTTTGSVEPKPSSSTRATPGVSVLVAPCVGEFVGTYSGSASGPASGSVGESGEITVALIAPDGDPVIRTSGRIQEDGLAFNATASAGESIQGSLDAATCTASGSWRSGTRQGSWQIGASPLEVRLEPSDCAGGVYVGPGAVTISLGGSPLSLPSPFGSGPGEGVTIGPLTLGESGISFGGESVIGVGEQGVTILGTAIAPTRDGVVIGDGRVVFDGSSIGFEDAPAVDLDTLCLSSTVIGHLVAGFGEIVDGRIEVRVGAGFTTYRLQAEILFDFGSDALNAAAAASLDQIVDSIAGRSDPAPITVIGHTDSIGTEAYNLDLSERRAEAVASALQADPRLSGYPVTRHGLGELQPVAANTNPDGTDNPAGRLLNRRVEIIVDTSGGIGGCVGVYAGSFIGGDGGTTGASLRSDGSLEVSFSPVGAEPGPLSTATVSVDGTITSSSGVGLSGRFDFSTCTAAGVWEDLGLTGRWNLSR